MNIEVLNFSTDYTTNADGWLELLHNLGRYEYPIAIIPPNNKVDDLLIEIATLAEDGKMDSSLKRSKLARNILNNIVEEFLGKNPSPKTELIRESCTLKLNQNFNRLHTFLKYAAKTGAMNAGLRDSIQALGTQTTTFLLAQCGLAKKIMAQYVDAARIIKTDENYGASSPNLTQIAQNIGSLETIMEDGFTPFIGTGFGETKQGTITILKNNNTASLIADTVHATIKEL